MTEERLVKLYEQIRKTYRGTLRDYDDGIEYVYEVPTADESKLAMIVRDFNGV